jgi:uncharacterized protein with GYD domain
MATFVVLATFSEQGIKNVKQTIERAEAFKQMAQKVGVTVKDMYWTQGSRDIVAICDAPDDNKSRRNLYSRPSRAISARLVRSAVGRALKLWL